MPQSGGAPRLPAGTSARCHGLLAGVRPQADDPAPHGGYDRREHDPGGLEAPMIMWGLPVLGCALVASALLLRRWPLAALAVTLGGSVASMVLQPRPSYALVVVACVVGLDICYIAATRTRRVSVAGAAVAVAALLIPLLTVPSLGSLQGGSLGGSAIPVVTIA